MYRVCLIVSLTLVIFCVAAIVADADGLEIERDATPRRLVSGPEIDREPIIAARADGQLVVAWKRYAEERGVGEIYAAQSPDWTASLIASSPISQLKRTSLALAGHDAVHLAWTYPTTRTQIIRWYTLGSEGAARLWEGTRQQRSTFALDDQGYLHNTWTRDNVINYLNATRDVTTTIETEPTMMVDELALALDREGSAYLSWVSLDPVGQGTALYYAQLISGTTPIQLVPAGRRPQLQVGPSGRVHLSWWSDGELYYTNSEHWSRAHLIDAGLAPSASFALAVGPGEVAYLAWIKENALWYACSLDWRHSKAQLVTSLGASGLSMAVDERGCPHIVWSAPDNQDNWDVYYLSPTHISAQLRITYPMGGETLVRDTLVQAESNLRPNELLRVEFYLQVEDPSWDFEDEVLLNLGLDRDGRDGWSVPLSVADLQDATRYRPVALGMNVHGGMIRAVGNWFTVQPQATRQVWLRPSGPAPTRGKTAIAALIDDTNAQLQHLQLFFTPVHCERQGISCDRTPLPSSQSHYVGLYNLPRYQKSSPARWQQMPYDSRYLPDGCYTALAIITDRLSQRTYSAATECFHIDNAMHPSVKLISPREGAVIKDSLWVFARASDPDGTVQRVDFYLERKQRPWASRDHEQLLETPHLFWLGSDTDSSDGWSVRTRVGQFWDGDDWYVRAIAYDDQGLSSSAPSSGPLTIIGRERPYLRILRPSSSRPLYGIERVKLLVTEGSEYLEDARLYVQDTSGALTYLGKMDTSDGAWVYDWDTRDLPDGSYSLVVIGHHSDGRQSFVRSEKLALRNGYAFCAFIGPAPGETLSGSRFVHLSTAFSLVPIDRVRFYYRDETGQLHLIGQDDTGENGWGTIWNTYTVLDGEYDLVALVVAAGKRIYGVERRVSVQNTCLSIEFGRFSAREHWRGFQRIFWYVRNSTGKPMSVTVEYSPDGGTYWMELARDIPSTRSFLWDTEAFPDSNDALLRLTVTDGKHYARTISPPFTLNNVSEPPYVTLLSPKSGHPYHGKLLITWHAWDPDNDALTIDLDYRRSGEPWRSLAHHVPNTGSYEWEIPDLAPANDYELRIVAGDPLDEMGTDSIQGVILESNRPPSVRLLWPNRGVRLERKELVLWRATDADDDQLLIDLYYSDDAGQTWLPLAEGLPNSGYYAWQVSYMPAGVQYRLRVVARDGLFQVYDESDGVFSIGENARPQVSLLAPTAGSKVSGIQLVRWFAFDPDRLPLHVTLTIRPWGEAGWEILATDLKDGFCLWDTREYSDGDYDLRVTADDGHSWVSAMLAEPVSVSNRSNHPPRIEIHMPRGGEKWTGTREITWDAWDPDGDVITATLYTSADGGQVWHELDTLDAHTGYYVWDTRQIHAGQQYLASIVVSDGITSTRDTSMGAFYLANQGHPPHLLITSPDPSGVLLRGNTATWIAEDVDGDPLTLSLSLSEDGGLTWYETAKGLYNTGEYIPSRQLKAGRSYRLRLQADDGLYRVQALSSPFEPATPGVQWPNLVIKAPTKGERWSGMEMIRWHAADPMGQPLRLHIEMSRDGGQTWENLARNVEDTGAYAWDTTRVASGIYFLRLWADNGQVSRVETSPPVIVDNPGRHVPVVSLTCPRGGDVWSGTQVIRWRAWDADGDSLSISLAYSLDDRMTWRSLAYFPTNTGSYIWDTTTMPNCEVVWLRISVSDGQFVARASSAGSFALRNPHTPMVSLLSPRGGEQWTGKRLITWFAVQGMGRPVRVGLDISLDLGRTWRRLAQGLPSEGRYLWDTATVPEDSRVLIRASAFDGLQSAVYILPKPILVRGNPALPTLPFYFR